MSDLDRLSRVEKWLDRAEYRLAGLEKLSTEDRKLLTALSHRLEMENHALTGLRWVVSIAGGSAIIIAVQRVLG